MMISLYSFSQKKYIVNKDTLICLTSNEARRVAIIMLEGERDSSLLVNCEATNKLLVKENVLLKQRITSADTLINSLEKSYYNCYDNVDKALIERDKAKKRLTIAKGLIVILTIIVFL